MWKLRVLLVCIFLGQSFSSLWGASPAQQLGKWWKNSGIVTALELSGRQIENIEQRYLEHRNKLSDLMNSLRTEESRLQSLMAIDAMDESSVLDQAERVAEARRDLEVAQTAMMLSFRKELSSAQWKKLEAMRELGDLRLFPAPSDTNASGTDAGKMFLPDGTEYYKIGRGISAPVVIEMPNPPYTDQAREAKTEGIVVLEAVVRNDGSVSNIKILRSLGYGLDESAIRTVTQDWLFKPGMLSGQPVNTLVTIEISFSLY